MRGVIAAGHQITAQVGQEILQEGGNAVDAAVAAVVASFSAEPLLTGLGSGGYMLIISPSGERVVLDFFIDAGGRGAVARPQGEGLIPVVISFGDAEQVFNIGPASCGVYGAPAGLALAAELYGTLPLADLVAPGIKLARQGVLLNEYQAYVLKILGEIITATPEISALFAPRGRILKVGDVYRNPELGDSLERLGQVGAETFYHGDIAQAVAEWIYQRGGTITRADFTEYEVQQRKPISISYCGTEVITNPPPSAGGILIAYALSLLARDCNGIPSIGEVVQCMQSAQRERTPEFLDKLEGPNFADQFFAAKLGSTTHISVLDDAGWACSVTCSNGEGAGIVIPGTGIHINNVMGEEDLNPHGFHRHEAGRRMPSMMAPTAVLVDGVPELVLGSGGSNRIRSTVLQTIVNLVNRKMSIGEAVNAPRLHFENNTVYVEPGIDTSELEKMDLEIARFRARNLFFGGVHSVARDPRTGQLSGAGDPRRGGVALVAE